eukprot:m.117726 g.117726  ORF g.117726 m.117726 type:complete len:80 (+) comp10950_c0_seq3:1359-1598(+)
MMTCVSCTYTREAVKACGQTTSQPHTTSPNLFNLPHVTLSSVCVRMCVQTMQRRTVCVVVVVAASEQERRQQTNQKHGG